jgi:hypothetical protein
LLVPVSPVEKYGYKVMWSEENRSLHRLIVTKLFESR